MITVKLYEFTKKNAREIKFWYSLGDMDNVTTTYLKPFTKPVTSSVLRISPENNRISLKLNNGN